MHHVVLDRWSRGNSPVHRRDPRAKILALAVFLIAVATAHRALLLLAPGLLLLLAATLIWARLPLAGVLARAAVVVPFAGVFALISGLAGDPARGLSLMAKSYLSALAVLVVGATTPLPALLRGFEMTGVPRFLLIVGQFLYRYLFVISEEAQHMRKAAAARGAAARDWMARDLRFRAAAGALGVLFARSHARAEDIHRAMLSRGFVGHFQPLEPIRFRRSDAAFAVLASLAPILVRIAVERAAR
ncbi:MAG: energy-coupling factor transporter transmembrane protein EcfT [Acidobacteriia bacterium]|nr:energy-coupling factor transporter transmembrane protein EcfT [Terriglobia bacterium]